MPSYDESPFREPKMIEGDDGLGFLSAVALAAAIGCLTIVIALLIAATIGLGHASTHCASL